MELDKNPKSVVFILTALGVFIIGIVLTLAFFSNTSLLGVGVAMAVIGGAGAILGCINLMARRNREGDAAEAAGGVSANGAAPARIPPPKEFFYRDSYREANSQGALYYEPCTASPPRVHRQPSHDSDDGADVDTVMITMGADNSAARGFFDPNSSAAAGGVIYTSPSKKQPIVPMLSPLEQRSYPVPKHVGSPIPTFAERMPARSGAGGASVASEEGPIPSGVPPRVGTLQLEQQGVTRRAPFQRDSADQHRTPSRNGGEHADPSWSPEN